MSTTLKDRKRITRASAPPEVCDSSRSECCQLSGIGGACASPQKTDCTRSAHRNALQDYYLFQGIPCHGFSSRARQAHKMPLDAFSGLLRVNASQTARHHKTALFRGKTAHTGKIYPLHLDSLIYTPCIYPGRACLYHVNLRYKCIYTAPARCLYPANMLYL